jgi:hypothetical protein
MGKVASMLKMSLKLEPIDGVARTDHPTTESWIPAKVTPALKPWSDGGLVEASSVLPGWVTGGTALDSAGFGVPFWFGEWATDGDSGNEVSGNDEVE